MTGNWEPEGETIPLQFLKEGHIRVAVTGGRLHSLRILWAGK
jgi:hypothetical protein